MTASVGELTIERQVDVRGAAPADFPTVPNTTAQVDGRVVLWLGPDEWLVLGGTEADFPDALSAVDVSANRVAFELRGDGARDVLARGSSLDLDAEQFPVGACAQTLLARAEVILHRTADAYVIFVRPSFAPYLRAWLDDAIERVGSGA